MRQDIDIHTDISSQWRSYGVRPNVDPVWIEQLLPEQNLRWEAPALRNLAAAHIQDAAREWLARRRREIEGGEGGDGD